MLHSRNFSFVQESVKEQGYVDVEEPLQSSQQLGRRGEDLVLKSIIDTKSNVDMKWTPCFGCFGAWRQQNGYKVVLFYIFFINTNITALIIWRNSNIFGSSAVKSIPWLHIFITNISPFMMIVSFKRQKGIHLNECVIRVSREKRYAYYL